VSENILRYFPQLPNPQKESLLQLKHIYDYWNSRINVISRKDMNNFMVHHVLHSLSIAKVISFLPGTRILDVGTGGGFPGIPLAIILPDVEFFLLDSVAKKIKVVASVADEIGLKNITPILKRVENEKGRYDFIISRAVTEFNRFVKLTQKNIDKSSTNNLKNGILYLKGGDLSDEMANYSERIKVWDIKDIFNEPFFETKKIVYLPV
jgi:16S rRNA (guanine527-N7)-methyltransferase